MASSISEFFLRIAVKAHDVLENEIVDHFNEIGDYISLELDPKTKPNQEFFDEWQLKLKVLDAAGFFIKQFDVVRTQLDLIEQDACDALPGYKTLRCTQRFLILLQNCLGRSFS